MAVQTEWRDPSERHNRGKEDRREFRRASDRRNAQVAALGDWLIRRQWRPVFLVDDALTLLASNSAAREAFERGEWLRQSDRRIEILDPDLAQQVRKTLEHWPKPRSDSIVLISSDRKLDLTALKLGHHLPTAYVVTILRLDKVPENAAQVLIAAGLTGLQARVALLIYQGATQSATAEEMRLSVNTIKSHLKGIYDKVGVASERELTRWVAETLAHGSSSDSG
jgi:DNA-binding CsgD family transcriptional regulator